MNKKQIIRGYWIAGITATVVIIGVTTVALLSNASEESLPNYALAELVLSALAFFVVWLTLYFIMVQLRKAMAKPELELIFTVPNSSECSINIIPNKEDKHYLRLSVVNKGNAITDLFQIEFDIPEKFQPTINSNTVNSVHHRKDGSNRIVSFINKHEYICFVNVPTPIPSLVLKTYEGEYREYSSPLIIPYKVYGDWAETQEGRLKVNLNKQELPHAQSKS
jgi:hypothetical protein